MGQEGTQAWDIRGSLPLGTWSTLLIQGQVAKGVSMAGSQNLNRPRAWGWHLVHRGGPSLADPRGETRVKGAKNAKGRKLPAGHTVQGDGNEGLKEPSLGLQGGHQPGLPPAFPLPDGRCRGQDETRTSAGMANSAG